MNRRSFFKTIAGAVAGVYAACQPGKADGLVHNKNVFVTPSGSPAGIEKRSGTFHWRNLDHYKDTDLTMLDCNYTRKDGKLWSVIILAEKDEIEQTKAGVEKQRSRQAIPGGAWMPTKDTKWILA